METNGKGEATTLILDEGPKYNIAHPIPLSLPLIRQRVIVGYIINEKKEVDITFYKAVFTPFLHRASAESKSLPLHLNAVWFGGQHLNFDLSLASGFDNHVENIDVALIGEKRNNKNLTLQLQLLYHATAPGDFYTQKTIISCNYLHFKHLFLIADSISIHYTGLDHLQHIYTFPQKN